MQTPYPRNDSVNGTPTHEPTTLPRRRLQVDSFGAARLAAEAAALGDVLDDLRGHCDPRGVEGRHGREFLPGCRHHCEGHGRIAACFARRFDDRHSAAAVRGRAQKLREIAGPDAVPHTPVII